MLKPAPLKIIIEDVFRPLLFFILFILVDRGDLGGGRGRVRPTAPTQPLVYYGACGLMYPHDRRCNPTGAVLSPPPRICTATITPYFVKKEEEKAALPTQCTIVTNEILRLVPVLGTTKKKLPRFIYDRPDDMTNIATTSLVASTKPKR